MHLSDAWSTWLNIYYSKHLKRTVWFYFTNCFVIGCSYGIPYPINGSKTTKVNSRHYINLLYKKIVPCLYVRYSRFIRRLCNIVISNTDILEREYHKQFFQLSVKDSSVLRFDSDRLLLMELFGFVFVYQSVRSEKYDRTRSVICAPKPVHLGRC